MARYNSKEETFLYMKWTEKVITGKGKNIVKNRLLQSEGHFIGMLKDKKSLVDVFDLMLESRFSSSLSLATIPSTVAIAERSFQFRSTRTYFRFVMATQVIKT